MNEGKQEGYDIEPDQGWEVDLFRPEDAEGVTSLFLSVYGEEYPIKTYIESERLIEENAAGRTISSVARTPKGDIVGHNALFNSAPYKGIYESGAGVVHSSYRGGKGIFTGLVAHGQDVAAKKFGVEGIYGESVCNHIYSQKLTARLGWITQAVEVDLMPAAAYEQEKSAAGRVASLLDFKTLKPRPHAVYLPEVYDEPLRFIYAGLNDERDIALSDKELPSHLSTEIDVQVFDFAQVARLSVMDAGTDFGSVIDGQEKAIMDKGMLVIQVWLSLSWPWVGKMVEVLRSRGYFLGGVLPRWFDTDGLLMQKLTERPHWEGIQLYSDRANKILNVVRSDWERVAAGT